jgi:RNA polymerase sigma-70 factor (ECF subfamily)
VDERDAVARLQRGDIGGLETLVRLYQVRAVRAAYLITRDAALADDIMQAAFLRAYERIGQFDATRPFGPWFLRGVVNDAVKAAARGAR